MGSLRGHRRYNAITALRSLFPVRQTGRPDFADPTAHLSGGRATERTLLPMTAEEIQAVQQAAGTPAHRLAVALAAVHAARPKAIRELTLDDIDLPSRRITLTGHPQPLGQRDRILHEALATGADPLHLSLIFKVGHTNAMAYANAARNLLTTPISHPAVWPGRRSATPAVWPGRRSATPAVCQAAVQPPQPSGQAAVQRPAARTRRGARANNRVRDPPVKDVSGDRDR